MDGSFEMFTQDWQPQTSLIRGGLPPLLVSRDKRSALSDARFVYDTAEEA